MNKKDFDLEAIRDILQKPQGEELKRFLRAHLKEAEKIVNIEMKDDPVAQAVEDRAARKFRNKLFGVFKDILEIEQFQMTTGVSDDEIIPGYEFLSKEKKISNEELQDDNQ